MTINLRDPKPPAALSLILAVGLFFLLVSPAHPWNQRDWVDTGIIVAEMMIINNQVRQARNGRDEYWIGITVPIGDTRRERSWRRWILRLGHVVYGATIAVNEVQK